MFKKPFSFEGRIRRTEFVVSLIIVAIAMTIIDESIGTDPAIFFVCIPVYWFLFAQGAKREHDLGYSGWWQLIPFRYFWLILSEGEADSNRFGKSPKNHK